MTSIPIDFTTQTSLPAPSRDHIKCSCGKKPIGQCNCERVHSLPPSTEQSTQAADENPKCSCGKNDAGACDCELASVENQPLAGQATCSCGMRPAGACTCSLVCHPISLSTLILMEQAVVENAPVDGPACACGMRPADGIA